MVVVRVIFGLLALAWVGLYAAGQVQSDRIERLEERYTRTLEASSPKATKRLEGWLTQKGVEIETKRAFVQLNYRGSHAGWVEVVNRMMSRQRDWMRWSSKQVDEKTVEGSLTLKKL